MFISFLPPFSAYYPKSAYNWIFHKQVQEIPEKEILYLLTSDYLKFQDSKFLEMNSEKIPLLQKIIIDELFSELPQSNNFVWDKLKTERWIPLESFLSSVFEEIAREEKIEAIFLWHECPSLEKIAETFHIPIIYNELGPLREPVYQTTIYFDFSGIHRKSEFSERLTCFLEEFKNFSERLFWKKEEIIRLFVSPQFLFNVEKDMKNTLLNYEIGVALQAQDSHSNGVYGEISNSSFLEKILKKSEKNSRILSRLHPLDFSDYSDEFLGEKDDSKFAYQFILKCQSIATINSNVAVEALLYNKPVYFENFHLVKFFGVSDLDELGVHEDQNDIFLNFLFFNYLIPYELIYNLEYYRWRLSKPSEREIYEYHQPFYFKRTVSDYREENFKITFEKIDLLKNYEEILLQNEKKMDESYLWQCNKVIQRIKRSIKKRL